MKIAILGSTGSIGTQTLEVVRNLDNIKVVALTAHSNVELLEKQIAEFNPKLAAVYDEKAAVQLSNINDTEILKGLDGIVAAASSGQIDLVVNALVGNIGLLPTLSAIEAGIDIALANKETLVCGGELIMPLAAEKGVNILPIDSEHSAIFQCISSSAGNAAERIYLTASGGPFRGYSKEKLASVSLDDALNHPNWVMGQKVTIDSATLMNKGLEVIEAKWLFDLHPDEIKVLVHPQSIIHSMVEFKDGQILAQLGPPDMRLPIQYALTHPKRISNSFARLNFAEHNSLTFEQPDFKNFPCLNMAYEAIKAGGLYPTVLNAANEAAVEMFLAKKISFTDIALIIDRTISSYNGHNIVDIDNILEVETWAKRFACETR